MAEVQSSGSQAVWPPKQKESNNGSYSSSRICAEGIWPSPNVNVSFSLFADSQEGNKDVTMGSVLPSFSSPPSKPSNGLVHDQLETGKKAESSSCFRLFGYVVPNSTAASLREKEPMYTTACCGAKGAILAAASELDQEMDVSKISKELMQVVPEIPPN